MADVPACASLCRALLRTGWALARLQALQSVCVAAVAAGDAHSATLAAVAILATSAQLQAAGQLPSRDMKGRKVGHLRSKYTGCLLSLVAPMEPMLSLGSFTPHRISIRTLRVIGDLESLPALYEHCAPGCVAIA